MPQRQSLLRRILSPAISRSRRFGSDERGVTAVEFGLLALPFFTLIFAIIETAMVFFASQVLDSAVEDASRMIRTGRAQSADYTLPNFRTLMCGYTFSLFGDCSQIKIKVAVVAKFADAVAPPAAQVCSGTPVACTWKSDFENYNAGIRRDVVQVTAYYRWPLLVVLPYFNLKNQPDNYRLLSATRVFRNEPF
ncbi:MAG: TadE/TadG family type IV pilus assembly protein [Devosia sp.]